MGRERKKLKQDVLRRLFHFFVAANFFWKSTRPDAILKEYRKDISSKIKGLSKRKQDNISKRS